MTSQTPVKRNLGKCSACGKPAEKISSGSPECWSCWNWRKMNSPMAHYWEKKIRALFEQGPDMWDVQTWNRMGIYDEMADALFTLEAFADRMEIAINTEAGSQDRRDALGYNILDELAD